ncbi:CBL-interacting serine/threonine-protein kinase 24-like protein [Tanacetum coccineum]
MNYVSVSQGEEADVSLDDVCAVFDDIEDQYVTERSEEKISPLTMNAFEMITLSQGLNLSALFDRRQDHVKRQTRFVSRKPAKDIIAAITVVAELMGFKVLRRGYKTRLEGASVNRGGQFAAVLEVYEVAPSLFMVDVRKAAGDTLEYHKASDFIFLLFLLNDDMLTRRYGVKESVIHLQAVQQASKLNAYICFVDITYLVLLGYIVRRHADMEQNRRIVLLFIFANKCSKEAYASCSSLGSFRLSDAANDEDTRGVPLEEFLADFEINNREFKDMDQIAIHMSPIASDVGKDLSNAFICCYLEKLFKGYRKKSQRES